MFRPRFLAGSATALAGAYLLDSEFNAKAFQRNFRTLWNGLCITYEYKVNFREDSDVNLIHEKVADRILHTCQQNGGLYIKFGQSVASMNHILPAAYNDRLKSLFQEAPTIPSSEVIKLFAEEFQGQRPEEVYDEFDYTPIASASIAQVHSARLKETGEKVAVKVQKPSIRKQIFWDMLGYRVVLTAFEILFDLPLKWTADFTESHLREEVDFILEAKKGERAASDFQNEPSLREDIYVPKIFWKFTTSRILTTEWIDGISLTKPEELKKAGISLSDVMTKVINAFSCQIFKSGFVHADPHIGNIIVRRNPHDVKKVQVCLLDHGLYVEESDEFRKKYSKFWKHLFLLDMVTLKKIATEWGINDIDIFASATLQRPFDSGTVVHLGKQTITRKDIYKMQLVTKERVKNFLADTEKIPKELIFVGRNLNLVRSNNKHLGSPVNRINIMAGWAARNCDNDEMKDGVKYSIQSNFNYWIFQSRLFILSITFYLTRWRQSIGEWLTGKRMAGFEDILDNQTARTMKNKLGIEVNADTFYA